MAAAIVVVAGLGAGSLLTAGVLAPRPTESPSPLRSLTPQPSLMPEPSAKPSPSPTVPLTPQRVPLPRSGGAAIVGDGRGGAWFVEGEQRLAHYRPGQSVIEYRLAAPGGTLAAGPDGAAWVTESSTGQLEEVTLDGSISQLQVGQGENSPSYVAVGRDGSVWYDWWTPMALVRRGPDGVSRAVPGVMGQPFAVDSTGAAWVPDPMVDLVRIAADGTVTRFTFDNGIEGIAEGGDSAMWFLDSTIGMDEPMRVGRIDASGHRSFFPFPNLSTAAWPNAIVRAPDGAVWFPTRDNRLVRLASATDVEVFTLPWPDVHVGPFAVLEGDRVVMRAKDELLDFVAAGGARMPGAGALPTPTPYVAASAAEAVAYSAARDRAGPNATIDRGGAWEGTDAAAFAYGINNMRAGHLLFVYVYKDAAGWHLYEAFGTQNAPAPVPGMKLELEFTSGCLNVRESPSLSAKVVGCLPTGTSIELDGLPRYSDGLIWWHVAGRGWAAQKYLWCTKYFFSSYPQC